MKLNRAVVVVVGGNGSLGRNLISSIKALDHNYRIISVGHNSNTEADSNVILSECTGEHYSNALSKLIGELSAEGSTPVSAVFCCAGGWRGGSSGVSGGLSSNDLGSAIVSARSGFVHSVFEMWDKNVASASFATALSPALTDGGLMVFVSSSSSLCPTPSMIGYGLSKAAVNHLVSSLAAEVVNRDAHKQTLSGTVVVSLLPGTLDTPSNRDAMPSTDGRYPSWTPLEEVSRRLVLWLITPATRPSSGALVVVNTTDGVTTFVGGHI